MCVSKASTFPIRTLVADAYRCMLPSDHLDNAFRWKKAGDKRVCGAFGQVKFTYQHLGGVLHPGKLLDDLGPEWTCSSLLGDASKKGRADQGFGPEQEAKTMIFGAKGTGTASSDASAFSEMGTGRDRDPARDRV